MYQDIFLKALELEERIDYDNNPKSWLLSVALRIWKNRKRKYAWRRRIADIQPIMERKSDKLDVLLRSALTPAEEPGIRLNQKYESALLSNCILLESILR